jgi:hypothetical protein
MPHTRHRGRIRELHIHDKDARGHGHIAPGDGALSFEQLFDRFREKLNNDRPHEALQMERPTDLYRRSDALLPERIQPYDYPGNYQIGRYNWRLNRLDGIMAKVPLSHAQVDAPIKGVTYFQ